jgi:hypothetical protein
MRKKEQCRRRRNPIFELAKETGASLPTVYAWVKGEHVSAITDYAIRAACRRLHISASSLLEQPPPGSPEELAQELTGTEG